MVIMIVIVREGLTIVREQNSAKPISGNIKVHKQTP